MKTTKVLINMKQANIKMKKKVSVKDTLLGIPVGETVEIKLLYAKPCSVRTMVYHLSKKGYSFSASERGLTDSIAVTRLK